MDKHGFIMKKLGELLEIVDELEHVYPGRKFTLDGHLFGSIGEILSEYYYNIQLHKTNTKKHDGVVDGKEVQIKITQGTSVDINDIPDYLIVLFLHKDSREVYEVYNGPGTFLAECQKNKNGWYNRALTTLNKRNGVVPEHERIMRYNDIKMWDNSIRN